MPMAPIIHGMVICDWVHRDAGNGKYFVLGTVSDIESEAFPVVHPVLFVHVQMTEVQGSAPIRFRMIRVVSDAPGEVEVFLTAVMTVPSPGPLAVIEVPFRMRGLRFDQPGEYRIQLLAWGQVAHERKLTVRQVP